MATADSVKTKIQNLITRANDTTHLEDVDLTNAVNHLVEGYGQGGMDSPLPIEVENEEKMNSLLAAADPGSVYKYTGETTDTYENGELYIVEAVE